MGCDIQKDAKGRVEKIVCSRGPSRCRWCDNRSTKLCDFVLENGTTCDAPMCTGHAKHIGFDTDYCPAHAEVATSAADRG